MVERITTRHTDVIECVTNIDTQTWSNALHVFILLVYVADGSILSFYVVDVSNLLELLFYVAHFSNSYFTWRRPTLLRYEFYLSVNKPKLVNEN